MLSTLLMAKSHLESEGLYVACNTPDSLWIAANLRAMGEGIRLSSDTCSLGSDNGHWLAIFPADGLFTYEVPGSLEKVVALICDVYRYYRSHEGPMKIAFRQIVDDPDQYVMGRLLASA